MSKFSGADGEAPMTDIIMERTFNTICLGLAQFPHADPAGL